MPRAGNVIARLNTDVREKKDAFRAPGFSAFEPATKLIMSGIMARTQGLDAVSIPPMNTAAKASQAFVCIY